MKKRALFASKRHGLIAVFGALCIIIFAVVFQYLLSIHRPDPEFPEFFKYFYLTPAVLVSYGFAATFFVVSLFQYERTYKNFVVLFWFLSLSAVLIFSCHPEERPEGLSSPVHKLPR